ncbi:MAG: hypothetical protein K2Y18_04650 [Alphaproteobacteria bacterium]|jgi:hypothetical protein|nr:hypothetical protein [Alphaproteobacteria bacterium]
MKNNTLFFLLTLILTILPGKTVDVLGETLSWENPFRHETASPVDQSPSAPPLLDIVDDRIGGDPKINVLDRLQECINTLSSDAPTLDAAVKVTMKKRREEASPRYIFLGEPRKERRPLVSVIPLMKLETKPDTNSPQARLQKLREQGKIGDTAWKLLNGSNKSLAAALSSTILKSSYDNPGKIMDALSIGTKSFKLRINGKEQGRLYKF